MVTNVCVKFNYQRLRIDKALGNFRKSDNNKCLRFGLWLTLCTLNIDLLTYLLTRTRSTFVALYGSNIIAMVDVDDNSSKVDSRPKTIGLVCRRGHLALSYIHQNYPGELM